MISKRPVTALVTRAANGDQRAWDFLVERYAPLVWSICRRYKLGAADAEEVGQTVWLQLTDHLGELREPTALAGWLAATTRRECSRARRQVGGSQAVGTVPEAESTPDAQTPAAELELLAAERDAALREAFTRLPRGCRQLIALLTGGQPLSDTQIGVQLGIPAASIRPRCGRCLATLRRDPAIAALLNPDKQTEGGHHGSFGKMNVTLWLAGPCRRAFYALGAPPDEDEPGTRTGDSPAVRAEANSR